MADEKTIYRMKTPSGDPVRVEEAWKDASGELLTEKVNKADAQTITGLKTFSTLPQSSATPSDDKDLATKKYSDDLWATRKAQEEKCYQALKTVTKDFTRTDPVYVRIGEDGEPEIHYTMTEADGARFFFEMDLGNATLYVHNGSIVTNFERFFGSLNAKRVFLDSAENGTSYWVMFGNKPNDSLKEIGAFKVKSGADLSSSFYGLEKLAVFPAFDFSSCVFNSLSFYLVGLMEFHAYGMDHSFSLSDTAIKHDAILEVFNNLGTVTAGSGVTLTLGNAKKALMTDDEIKIATDKGWEVA